MTFDQQKLLELIPRVIDKVKTTSEEVMQRLDAREDRLFADHWMASFRRLSTPSGRQDGASERLREAAYLAAFKKWNNPDIAAFISDDFGLFAELLQTDHGDSFTQWLAESYFIAQQFPSEIGSSDIQLLQILRQVT